MMDSYLVEQYRVTLQNLYNDEIIHNWPFLSKLKRNFTTIPSLSRMYIIYTDA